MKVTTIATFAASLAAALPLAAQTVYNPVVAAALRPVGRFQAPICPLPGGDFHSSSAGTYLKTASEGFQDQSGQTSQVDSKKYADQLGKAIKASLDGIAANPKNTAAWYYLGRADLQLGDLRGADSALSKTEELSPACAADLKAMRQKAWFPLVSPTSDMMRNKQYDSALVYLRNSVLIARYYPQGYFNLAGVFANTDQPDSAIFYFKIAEQKAEGDKQFETQLKGTAYNLAFLYDKKGDYADAVTQYRKYLAIDSTDVDAKRGLANALRQTGNGAEADRLQGQLAASGALSEGELNQMAIDKFKTGDYAAAAEQFKKVLAIDPYSHDAMYNLANCYLGLKDGKNLIDAATRLLEIAPLGKTNVQLLVNGYRLTADTTKWIAAVGRLQAMPISVNVSGVTIRADGAKIVGQATGNQATTASGKDIAPAPVTLVFELIDIKGNVVASKEVTIPALQPNATQDIAIDASGASITGWRYHTK